jgi:hypothetical protein
MSAQIDTAFIIRPREQAAHVGFIGAGGYGEIHSVQLPSLTVITTEPDKPGS